jgi:hypothetical protein
MKRLLNIAVMALAFFVHAQAQADTSFHLVKRIPADIAAFAVDNLDNLYLLGPTNQLKKLGPAGDSIAVFNDVKKFGKAALIDVSNPLKVLLYYPGFATIVVLDRLLDSRNTIDLRKQNILQVQAIGQSYDNKIWLYDELENKLKKIDEEGKVLLETPDFRLLFGEAPVPQQIFDQDGYVYLYDPAKGVFVFDYYGTLKNKLPITGWQNFKVAGKYIFGSAGNTLFRYNVATFRTEEWKLPAELSQTISFTFSSSRLYALKKNSIEIYSFH